MPVSTVRAGDEASAAWANQVAQSIADIRAGVLGLAAGGGTTPLIARHADNPAFQQHAVGATITLDWAVQRGAQARWRASRRANPVDPLSVEWWQGSAWGGAARWITSSTTQAELGGWGADDIYAVSVEIADADGNVSNRATWAISIGDSTDANADGPPLVTVSPQTQSIANDVTQAAIRVAASTTPGVAPTTTLEIKRTAPDDAVTYWNGSAWVSSLTFVAYVADARGGMNVTLTGLADVGTHAIDVTPVDGGGREGTTTEVGVTKAAAGTSSPAIVQTGSGKLTTTGAHTLAWTYSDADSHAQRSYRLRRVRVVNGATEIRYWDGSAWSATDQQVTSAAAMVAIAGAMDDDAYLVQVWDTTGAQSNQLRWEVELPAMTGPTITVTPSSQTIASGATTATIRVVGSTGVNVRATATLRIRRTAPDDAVTYWDGDSWEASAASRTTYTADRNGGMNVALTGLADTGDHVLQVIAFSADGTQGNVIRSATITKAEAANVAPVITGGGSIEPGTRTLTWNYSDADDDAQKQYRLVRTRSSSVAYWTGSAFSASDQRVTSAATSAAVGTVRDGDRFTVQVWDAEDNPSNVLTWDVAAITGPAITVTPAAQNIANDASTATIRVVGATGTRVRATATLRIRRTNPANKVTYWDGDSWETSAATRTTYTADRNGGMDVALTGLTAVGDHDLQVIAFSSDGTQGNVIRSAAVTKLPANRRPVVTARTVPVRGGTTIAWNYSDADDDDQKDYELTRTRGSNTTYWNGSAFTDTVVRVASTATSVTVPAISGGDTYTLHVRDTENNFADLLTWTVPTLTGPAITVSPASRSIENSVSTAAFRVVGSTGANVRATATLRIRRTDPGGTVRYWDGDSWETAATTRTTYTADQNGGMDISFTGFGDAGTHTLQFIAFSSDGTQGDVIRSVSVTKAAAANRAPAIVRSGGTTIISATGTVNWTYSDADGHKQKEYRLRRVRGNSTHYWTGSAWSTTDQRVTSAATGVALTGAMTLDVYTVQVWDTAGSASNTLTWQTLVQAGPAIPVISAGSRDGNTIKWTYSGATTQTGVVIGYRTTTRLFLRWDGVKWVDDNEDRFGVNGRGGFIAHTSQSIRLTTPPGGWSQSQTTGTGGVIFMYAQTTGGVISNRLIIRT